MNNRRVVRFATLRQASHIEELQLALAPERAIETSRIGVWVAITMVLWALIVVPAIVI